ncbi:hypothetical protein H5410_016399 [Solanum commersonii]|uniref:Uncharacterized protein n=1 Tax=Solanum commersonii TaxID=4109 RepID=A0A9J5ZXI7_SOLCO|nr:hypothetical protein H5410_016399 [Solanum commersonii]
MGYLKKRSMDCLVKKIYEGEGRKKENGEMNFGLEIEIKEERICRCDGKRGGEGRYIVGIGV